MAKTRSDLIHRALKNLGALPQGMNPSQEEYNAIDELVDPFLEDLIARDVCFIEDVDAIEEKYFLALGNALAGVALPEFGLMDDAALVAKAQKAEKDLKQISATYPTYSPLEIQDF